MDSKLGVMFKINHQIAQTGDSDNRNAVIALNLLNGRQVALSTLLAIKRNQDASRNSARSANQFNRFANRGAR